MSDTDLELLARFARDRADEAFAELVRRHLGLVHSAALRQVRSPQLAEEVAQSAFLKLAQHARQLAPGTVLSAWLYQVTRREAIDVVRREARRQLREQIATEMNAMNATVADWTHIEPLLDDAMAALDETDRAAVLLRYFENKSLREVGEVLGASENAAQKRLTRAVERLREFFAKQGIGVSTTSLIAVIGSNAVQAAPVGLAAMISTAAVLAGPTLATFTTATTAKTIAMTATQKVLITGTLVTAVGGGFFQAWKSSNAESALKAEQQHRFHLSEQVQSMTDERADAERRLAALSATQGRLDEATTELIRLRGEISRLQQLTKRLTEQTPPTDQQSKVWRNGESRRVDDFHDVGALTVEACFESVIWAVKNNPQRLLNLVHLPENIPADASAGPDLAKLIALRTLWGDSPMQEVSLRGGGTIKYARNDGDQQTIIHDDLKSFFLVGRLLDGREVEIRNGMYFGEFPEGWKMIIPDLSPPTVSKAAE